MLRLIVSDYAILSVASLPPAFSSWTLGLFREFGTAIRDNRVMADP
jgi:hypothetical protein